MTDLKEFVNKFKGKKILVYGDVMLDLYIRGDVERISPEAPVPVIMERSREYVLGGAGNVAANAASLGGKVVLVGVVGADAEAKIIRDMCRALGIEARLVAEEGRPTAVKARAVAKRHQLLRMDRESTAKISKATQEKIFEVLKQIKNVDCAVISDYTKGCITPKIIEFIKKHFGNHNVIAGMKPLGAVLFKNVEAVALNLKEGYVLTGISADSDRTAARAVEKLAEIFKSSVVLTRGEYGITTFDKKSGTISHIPTRAVRVYDVTGAGDTVLAALALMRSSGATLAEAAELANYAAGIVVGMEGTTAIPLGELKEVLSKHKK